VRVVADTHALLLFLDSSPLLSEGARSALREAQATDGIIISTAMLADLCYVTQTTNAFSTQDLDAVRDVVADQSTAIDLAAIPLHVFEQWRRLDRRIIADPWDRFIVATALAEGVPPVANIQVPVTL
jgi:PIN domain nuclease of toxin-antitoxin system